MIKILIFFLQFIVLGTNTFCYASSESLSGSLASSSDVSFKMALAKVVFFLSILAIGAALIKKHKKNNNISLTEELSINKIQELYLSNQTKVTLLDIDKKRILVASSSNGGLALLELSSKAKTNQAEDSVLELATKNVSVA